MPDETDLPLDDAERRVTELLHSMTAGDLDLIDPPADVWAGIEAELDLSASNDSASEAAGASVAPVIDLASRRRRIAARVAAVAAAVAVIAGLAVVITADDAGGPIEVANASLQFDPETFDPLGEGRSASATLLDSNGTQSIRIDTSDLPVLEEDADLELWLIGVNGEEIEAIQTLGLVADPERPGTYDIPADFDRDAFDTVAVDISIEPHDGDEAHSGRSIVRGPLTST